jgi:hypothetical protein
MQPRDKISKSSWTLHETVKDALATNVANAIRSGQLKIEAASIEKLLSVINASADEGYHKGHRTFMKIVDENLHKEVEHALMEATMPDLRQAGSKKK